MLLTELLFTAPQASDTIPVLNSHLNQNDRMLQVTHERYSNFLGVQPAISFS